MGVGKADFGCQTLKLGFSWSYQPHETFEQGANGAAPKKGNSLQPIIRGVGRVYFGRMPRNSR